MSHNIIMRQNSNKVYISRRVFDAVKALVEKLVFEGRFLSQSVKLLSLNYMYFVSLIFWYIWIYYLPDFDRSLENIKILHEMYTLFEFCLGLFIVNNQTAKPLRFHFVCIFMKILAQYSFCIHLVFDFNSLKLSSNHKQILKKEAINTWKCVMNFVIHATFDEVESKQYIFLNLVFNGEQFSCSSCT